MDDVEWSEEVQEQLEAKGYEVLPIAPLYVGLYVAVFEAVLSESVTGYGGSRSRKDRDLVVKVIDRNLAREWRRGHLIDAQIEFLSSVRPETAVSVVEILQPDDRWVFVFMEPAFDTMKHVLDTMAMDEEWAKGQIQRVAYALAHIHSAGWAHRDINPAAILFADKYLNKAALASFSSVIKIRKGQNCSEQLRNHSVFTPPEQIAGVSYDAKAGDVFSLGVLMFVSLTGSSGGTLENLENSLRSSAISDQLRDWIGKMTGRNPDYRPKMKTVIGWIDTWVAERPGWPVPPTGHEIANILGPFGPKNELLPKILEARGYRVDNATLGHGLFATVYRAWKGKKPLALKVITLGASDREYQKKFWKGELDALRLPDHPNVIRVLDVLVEKSARTPAQIEQDGDDRKIFIFMERAKCDLRGLKNDQPEWTIAERYTAPLLHGAALGMIHLHKHNMTHSDLHDGNILLKSRTHALITDFSQTKHKHSLAKLSPSEELVYKRKERGWERNREKRRSRSLRRGVPAPYDDRTFTLEDAFDLDTKDFAALIYETIGGQSSGQVGGFTVAHINGQAISDQAKDLIIKMTFPVVKDGVGAKHGHVIPFLTAVEHEWFKPETELTYEKWPVGNAGPPPAPGAPVPEPIWNNGL